MHEPNEFLRALAIVLAVAALTTVVFQRLRQPVVLGYLIAGLIVGPHVPVPLVADPSVVHTLSELGVILLMFSLGLEFSLKKLAAVGPAAGLTALLQSSLMVWLGFLAGRAFGWTPLESLFAGAAIAISSTTIIAKAFDEQGVRGRLRELVVAILVVEDLIAILMMALLTGVASGQGLAPGPLAATVGRLAAFLVGLVSIGLLVVPRAVRAVVKIGRRETTLVASIGLCFCIALLADAFGYSVALGAFIAGSLVAESGEAHTVETLVEPVRDVFAAIFFVSVGMQLDPGEVSHHLGAVGVLTLAVVVGKIASVSLGAFLTGAGLRTSVQAGMSLAQIGEFSFIIAGLGLALGAARPFLYPVAVAVSALTTLLTPWLIRASGPLASWLDRSLPKPIQTFAALYASWLETLRARPESASTSARAQRLLRLLLVDVALLALLIVGTASSLDGIAALAQRRLGVSSEIVRPAALAAALALAAPLAVGVVRVGRRLGGTLAESAFPRAEGADLSAAPRRALVVALQLVIVLAAGAPLLAVTQPFLPVGPSAALLAALLALLGAIFWRRATDLEGHVRAGAQAIAEALSAGAGRRSAPAPRGAAASAEAPAPLDAVHRLLPGLGALVAVRIEPASGAVGRTLAELDLRGLTGATVLAISRAEGALVVPAAGDRLRAGDVLALAGSHDAIEHARRLLGGADAGM